MFRIYIDSSKRHHKIVKLYDSSSKEIDLIEGDIDIVSSIEGLLSKHHISISNVKCDFFKGPGESFTGLKVGAVISNLINWSNGQISSTEYELPDYGREPNISERKSN